MPIICRMTAPCFCCSRLNISVGNRGSLLLLGSIESCNFCLHLHFLTLSVQFLKKIKIIHYNSYFRYVCNVLFSFLISEWFFLMRWKIFKIISSSPTTIRPIINCFSHDIMRKWEILIRISEFLTFFHWYGSMLLL